ncbi:unnamed protein product [Musa hybrid cultivar]
MCARSDAFSSSVGYLVVVGKPFCHRFLCEWTAIILLINNASEQLPPVETNNNKEADQRMVFPGELGVYVDNISFQRIGYSVDDRSKRTKKELHMRNQRVTQC